jgi:GAF domain-containing protein
MSDEEFAPYRKIARRQGFRAVQSVPLVSSGGEIVGVLSTHFPLVYRPTEMQMDALRGAAEWAANAIILRRVCAQAVGDLGTDAETIINTRKAINESVQRMKNAQKILRVSDELMRE